MYPRLEINTYFFKAFAQLKNIDCVTFTQILQMSKQGWKLQRRTLQKYIHIFIQIGKYQKFAR